MAVGQQTDNGLEPHPDWSRRAQDIAAILWPSFLAAAAATMIFFALIDPAALAEATFPALDIGRSTGYAIGFFFFWLLAAGSSLVTVFLIRTKAPKSPVRE